MKKRNSIYELNNLDFINEWDISKNGEIDNRKVKLQYAWWICNKCGYKWRASIYDRIYGNGNCLKCDSLGLKNENLIKEWSSKNSLSPFNVRPSSSKLV